MGLFDDFGRFIETQLDDYLKKNPHLELYVLEEKLRDQEQETLTLITDLKRQETQLQEEILALAREIQLWHVRIAKAKAAGRTDLTQPAEEHEASLLRQGNQRWGQMEVLKVRIQQTQELHLKIQTRRKEVEKQAAQTQTTRTPTSAQAAATTAWTQMPSANTSQVNDLNKQFQQWEAQEELEQLKRNLGK
jgi:uncharacterized protein (TIGR04376 family)